MHPQKVFEALQQRTWGDVNSTINLVNEVGPADLFCYLGARFGQPNGVQNALRSDDSDNLIHWDWTLQHKQGVIVFLGMNFKTEVLIMGLAPDQQQKADLVNQLKADFANHGTRMGEIRRGLEHWIEFVNPYQRIRRAVERLRKDLNGLDLRPDEDRFDPLGPAASQQEVENKWNDLARRYNQGFGLCFGIRSMLPVMAEAFVNLLLYILMRSEIRNDQRLAENVIRQPIDVRIKSLSINCIGFKRQPDYTTEECRSYQSLVNERNDLLHGNVVIDKLKFNDVCFWGKVPVFKEYRSVWERSLQVEIRAVGLQALKSEAGIVDALIEYLLSCLEEAVRKNVEFMVDRHQLGVNQAAGRIGVLFPEHLVDMQAEPSETRLSDESV